MSYIRRLPHLLLLGAVLFVALPATADDDTAPTQESTERLVPARWLLLPHVDGGGRAPFNPSAVFARYLWKADAPPPREGDAVRGASGREAKWRMVEPDENGNVPARGISTAHAVLDVDTPGVWLAEVNRAGLLYVNGVPHGGDVYGHGITKVPVRLEKGVNHLYAAGFRGAFRVVLEKPPEPVFLATWDATLPDLVVGDPPGERERRMAGILVVNASTEPVGGLRILSASIRHGEATAHASDQPFALLPTLPPGGMLKVPVRLPSMAVEPGEPEARLEVRLGRQGAGVVHEQSWSLDVRGPNDVHRRTFLSKVDDSVQFYGVRPPVGDLPEGAEMGLVLSLHGASVDAWNQARCYSPRPDFWVVAATNRRPFGFDWHDWGRQDAYEVLADALRLTGVDRRHVHLTGHSMGGHGAWHLAANDPDGFASVAPSAAWISFDTYGHRPRGSLSGLWHAADRASLTLELLPNLRDVPIYVLHGTKDNEVPISEAKHMERVLEGIARDFSVHYEEGAKHWWNGEAAKGTDCVDWPPFFDMFRKHRIPDAPTDLDFTSADLSVDADHHWVRIEQPLQYGGPCRIRAAWDEKEQAVEVTTSNIRRFVLTLPEAWAVRTVTIDGKSLPLARAGDDGPPTARHDAFVWGKGGWASGPIDPPSDQKRPDRMGPFKRAFDRGFVLVYGTAGTDDEDEALLQAARYDSQRWRYRANGLAVCITDVDLLANPKAYRDRNLILYGNADTNAAWKAVFPENCPILPKRGKVRLGMREWEGDSYGILFVYPRKGSETALAAAVANTGVPGTRLGFRSPYFLSGVGYPDFVLYGPEVLERGDDGVRVAGLFDDHWRIAD